MQEKEHCQHATPHNRTIGSTFDMWPNCDQNRYGSWLSSHFVFRFRTKHLIVPKVGFEPTWGYPHPLLRRARLPFRHFGLSWSDFDGAAIGSRAAQRCSTAG